jgi:glycosyltransferase involved in cell wall biosynthesis
MLEISPKVLVVLLTWKRLDYLPQTLERFANQTYAEFHLHVSHGNFWTKEQFKKIVHSFKGNSNLTYSIDSNSTTAFRRFFIARSFAEHNKADIVIFVDDDIAFSETFIQTYVANFEPKTIKSNIVWNFSDPSSYYESRTRVTADNEQAFRGHLALGQCAMYDANIFLEPQLFREVPPLAKKYCDDMWISFVASKILGYRIRPLRVDAFEDLGDDDVALFRLADRNGKARDQFLKYLANAGWLR